PPTPYVSGTAVFDESARRQPSAKGVLPSAVLPPEARPCRCTSRDRGARPACLTPAKAPPPPRAAFLRVHLPLHLLAKASGVPLAPSPRGAYSNSFQQGGPVDARPCCGLGLRSVEGPAPCDGEGLVAPFGDEEAPKAGARVRKRWRERDGAAAGA